MPTKPTRTLKRIALDTETTGLDLQHGAKPYLVTICNEQGVNTWWEWSVNPMTREPRIMRKKDLTEIQDAINSADELILQNSKFDYVALQTIFDWKLEWDWSKVHDTLLAGHLLASNQPHDLTTMTLVYLHVNVQPYEDRMKDIVKDCLREAKDLGWSLAKAGRPDMPSAKKSVWKFDAWVPRALARHKELPKDHPWYTVTSDYANSDSASTIALYKAQKHLLLKRGLWKIYQERLKVLPVVVAMESRGITLSSKRHKELIEKYNTESTKLADTCYSIAGKEGYGLELPKSGSNNSLHEFVFDVLKLPVVSKSAKTSKPSMDGKILEHWETTLDQDSKQVKFVKALRGKRKRDTALTYLESYKRFQLPIPDTKGWYVLHPSLNPTGTDTLRWSSSNPNEQNISKKEGFNIRYCFGPSPGREWWSLDAKNIELRIPAYESGERELIDLFERPDEPPYYGSTHLLNFHTIYTDLWNKELKAVGIKEVGPHCKKKYASTWYQWCKNGGFAVQYGAVDKDDGEGTADRAFHMKGAQAKLKSRFSKLEKLNQKYIDQANKYGYVTTTPDVNVDPTRGYPLLCTRNRWGGIKPTIPLNYHVQSTAMWWMMKAMIRCHEYLQTLPDHYLVMQIHDEMVFDFPLGKDKNLPKIKRIQKLMEKGGDDLGLPTPVSIEYHPNNWSEGTTV